jgi:hypothetical protein
MPDIHDLATRIAATVLGRSVGLSTSYCEAVNDQGERRLIFAHKRCLRSQRQDEFLSLAFVIIFASAPLGHRRSRR